MYTAASAVTRIEPSTAGANASAAQGRIQRSCSPQPCPTSYLATDLHVRALRVRKVAVAGGGKSRKTAAYTTATVGAVAAGSARPSLLKDSCCSCGPICPNKLYKLLGDCHKLMPLLLGEPFIARGWDRPPLEVVGAPPRKRLSGDVARGGASQRLLRVRGANPKPAYAVHDCCCCCAAEDADCIILETSPIGGGRTMMSS